MKINELKTIAKENDYELKEEKEIEQITLERKVTFDGFISNVITISSAMKDLIFIKSKHCDNKDFNMIKAAVEFAETAIEDREEEKKFRLKHKWITSGGFYMYVTHHTKPYGEVYELLSWRYGEINGMQFTLKEIEKIKKEFNTDLKDFEMVEVEE